MVGGAIAFSPASVEAAGKKVSRICPQQVGHPCHDQGRSKRKPLPPPRFGKCKPRPGFACLH
jgi:hypothetical protein